MQKTSLTLRVLIAGIRWHIEKSNQFQARQIIPLKPGRIVLGFIRNVCRSIGWSECLLNILIHGFRRASSTCKEQYRGFTKRLPVRQTAVDCILPERCHVATLNFSAQSNNLSFLILFRSSPSKYSVAISLILMQCNHTRHSLETLHLINSLP